MVKQLSKMLVLAFFMVTTVIFQASAYSKIHDIIDQMLASMMK